MTMRAQIETGVYNAITNSLNGPLSNLSNDDATALVDSVLAALSQAPQGTPVPTLTVTPAATPMLVLSPADVVARAAQDALDDLRIETHGDTADLDIETWHAGSDYKQFREFLFRTQSLFGVRVRSMTENGVPVFKVAGQAPQRRAFQRTMQMVRDLAAPVVTDMTPEQASEFWATVGVLCADADTADHLIESNRGHFQTATDMLNREFGLARTLNRTTPANAGEIFEQAQRVAAATTWDQP